MHDSTTTSGADEVQLTDIYLSSPDKVDDVAHRKDVGTVEVDGWVYAVVYSADGRYGWRYQALARSGGAA